VLTISKPLSSGQAQTYHHKEFTAKEQSYWSQGNAVQGEWQGRLAAKYGLVGAVSAEDFAKLSQGQHPETGERLFSIAWRTNTKTRTVKPSRRWNIGQVGTLRFLPRNPFHSLLLLVAISEYGRHIAKASG
jgi:hypothetical protein